MFITKKKINYKGNLSEFLNNKYWLFKILNHALAENLEISLKKNIYFYTHKKYNDLESINWKHF